jgi:valyl-tRNA synthetase
MDKTYNPTKIENAAGNGAPYCIMLPPPNVTGNLHMGHAFQQTMMDVLIRYHRMNGDCTLWQCGTDHAGIATQMVVERQLEMKGQNRWDLGREKFTEAIWKWKEESGSTITNQSRRLGTSMDWSRERFTMDEGLSDAVKEVFVRLYDEGLIYRGKRLVNWDPILHTAISDLEVLSEEENGNMWHIRYPRCDGKGHVIVATTRPETLLGDAAVAVHPDDERYQDLIGHNLELPLTGRKIPVIADEYVDPEFGTGCVKITPAHDFNDYEVGERHTLPLINIFTHDAKINSKIGLTQEHHDNTATRYILEDADLIGIPKDYRGKDRFEARKLILNDLEAAGLLEKTEPHKLMVPRGDRSGAVIEPYLTDQWYVKIQPLAEPAIAAVEKGDIKFVPENWDKTYYEWMCNIEDWCISRQLWWGHQIPAWYDEAGNVYVGRSEEEVREKYASHLTPDSSLVQDEDVLDTWFSSALWPFSTLGWPEKTPELETFYPTSVLVTGFDIIFFWVARMIMMGIKFMGDVPFREVYIHGLVRDSEGQKMSKSKGNILDPLDLIDGIDLEQLVKQRTTGMMRPSDAEKITKQTRKHFPEGIDSYGTDALRFTFASLATQGRGINFDVGRIAGYRNFCNKIWNASRYVFMNLESGNLDLSDDNRELGLAEHWINARFNQAINNVNTGINTYRFDIAAQAIYEFTWDEYCDWYLELSKTTLTDESASDSRKRGTLFTLVNILEQLLRLMHPFMPFITEEIWHRTSPILGVADKTIMNQPYPAASTQEECDKSVLIEMSWVKRFILGVRRIRSERDIAPGKPLAVQVMGGSTDEQDWLERNSDYIKTLGKITTIIRVNEASDDTIIALAGNMTILVPLADIIDPKIESARLEKELARLNIDKQRIEGKLNNSNFIDRAPQDVVDKEKQKLEDTLTSITKLEEQHQRIIKLL